VRTGLISSLLSCLLGRISAASNEFLVPIDKLVSAPIMWVVFFCGSTVDRKFDSWLLNLSSSDSLYPEWGEYIPETVEVHL
jgi:hypothetical protein